MRTTMGWVLSAGLVVGGAGVGCAQHAASVRVGEQSLARVSEQDMSEVNERRLELARANDAVARERLEVKTAEQELDLAKRSEMGDVRVVAAQAMLDLKKQNEKVARARAQHAQARLEWAKYDALQRSGDPSTKEVDVTRLKNAVAAAEAESRQEESARQAKLQRATQLRQELEATRSAPKGLESGTGGAGQ